MIHQITQEKGNYISYAVALIVLGFIFACFGFYLFIVSITNIDSPNSFLGVVWGGGLIGIPSAYVIAKGFSRQRFVICKEGFVPYWKSLIRPKGRDNLVPWSEVSHISRVDIGETFDRTVLWVDIIIEQRGQNTVCHVVDPRFMDNYTESTLYSLELSEKGIEFSHFVSVNAFLEFLSSLGIDPATVHYQSGRFSVPAITG